MGLAMHPVVLGTIGSLCVLATFIANRVGTLSVTSPVYNVLNAAGAGLLVAYSISLESLPFVAINTVWLAASCIGLIHAKYRRSRHR